MLSFVVDDSWKDRWVQSKNKDDFGEFKLSHGKFYGDAKKDQGEWWEFLIRKVSPLINCCMQEFKHRKTQSSTHSPPNFQPNFPTKEKHWLFSSASSTNRTLTVAVDMSRYEQ